MTKRQPSYAVILACTAALFASGGAAAQNVTTYHNGNDRHGAYVVPGLTAAAAAGMHLDRAFDGRVSGSVYAQPLFWQPLGEAGRVIVATEANVVEALDAGRGTSVWQTRLPPPAPLGALGCGNIAQEGITGTPAIDPQDGTIYLDAVTDQRPDGVRHMVYAVSAETGAIKPGWPLDIQAALQAKGVAFDSTIQGQRGALLLLAGRLFITYGGRWGDCGAYRGMVVQVDPARAAVTGHWATRAEQGGIWAQGGASSDGSSIFVTTGNTTGATAWGDGESVIRLHAGLSRPATPADYLTPGNWRELDDQDADLGGTGAVPLTVPAAQGALSRVLAFGKDGRAYLADAANLGGVGGALAVTPVSRGQIITAPAVLQTPAVTMVAFRNADGPVCHGSSLSMLRVAAGSPTPLAEAWCARVSGAGAPIATTSDGGSDSLVWVVGAQGDGLLHGFDALTGRTVFDGGGQSQSMSGLRHFATILAADQHFYVAATGRIYAFVFTR